LLASERGLALLVVVPDEGVDLAEAFGFVAVLAVPFLPCGELFLEAVAALPEVREDFLGAGLEPLGAAKPYLGLAAIVTR
jgi:hypothetical protein